MKLDKVLAIVKPFLAADKKPEDLEAAIRAANDGMPGNVASSKEIEDRRTKDRAARDKARDEKRVAADAKRTEDRAACDAKHAKDRAARDKKWAKDRDDDPEHTNDADVMKACDADMESEAADESKAEDEGDPTTPGGNRAKGKPAMDSAEVDTRIAAAVEARDELHAARAEVEPIVGKVALDSAADVRRAGLKALGVETKGVHDSALKGMLELAKSKAASTPPPTPGALDGASVSSLEKLIPGYGRLR